MHSLAISLANSGYQVTGSDDKIYDPSLTRLKKMIFYQMTLVGFLKKFQMI